MRGTHKHIWLDDKSDAYICISHGKGDDIGCVSLHDEQVVVRVHVTKKTLDKFINLLSELRLRMYRD